MTALNNGNYVVSSLSWDNGAVINVGAVTWGNGATGVTGEVSMANSLIGSTASAQTSIAVLRALLISQPRFISVDEIQPPPGRWCRIPPEML